MNEAIEKLKKGLAKEKKPSFAYPQVLVKYSPDSWCELDTPGTGEVEEWAGPYVWKRVPPIIKSLVSWDLTWQVLWLPRAKYELLGVPSLVWSYKAQVLAKVNLAITERRFNKQFHGHERTMMVQTQDLGSFYLGSVEWGDDQEGFFTPVALLSMLSEGKLEEDGIEIIGTADTRVGYIVRGYQGEYVEIDQKFRQFIIDITKDNSLAKGLLASGVIDELTADLIGEKAKLALPQVLGAGQTFSDDSDVITELEAMGYKNKEIKEAMEAASLFPTTPLEEKVAAVLKILSKDTP